MDLLQILQIFYTLNLSLTASSGKKFFPLVGPFKNRITPGASNIHMKYFDDQT